MHACLRLNMVVHVLSVSLFLIVMVMTSSTRAQQQGSPDPPKWPNNYQVQGYLKIPYAELNEDFSAYYDSANNRSRIDYYGDSVQTFQFAGKASGAKNTSYGASYKIAYMSTLTKFNTKTCFLVNGTNDSTVELQSVLPNMTGFALVEQNITYDSLKGVNKWFRMEMKGKKKNTYTMYVTADGAPHRYEIFGFDSLLGSHYDKYYITYNNYDGKTKIPDKMFQVLDNSSCSGFSLSYSAEHRALFNPMREYINHDDSHHQEMFQKFKKVHDKNYENEKEHARRESVFRQNVRFIHSKNRANLTYSLAVNHMADRSREELKLTNGRLHSKGYNGGLAFDKSLYNKAALPDQLDWRLFGAVNPVKDQAVCGSCWSFGTTGTIEGAYFLATGKLIRLSQQQLMDCSWGQGNNACDGGEEISAYKYVMKGKGLATSDAYGPYMAQDMQCHSKDVNMTVQIESYVNVTSNDLEALKIAMVFHGPISVAIDASHLSLSFYTNGVYYEKNCRKDDDGLDHAVLAVGYGVLNGEPYWLVKNSWSTYWGNDGYVLMSMKDNNCGVATSATFVNIKKSF